MFPRLTMIGLGVNDLAVSRNFYENILELSPTASSNEDIIFYQLNGFLLSLHPRQLLAEDAGVDPEGSGFRGFTLAHNLRSDREVDAFFDNLKTKGVRIVKPPVKVFWGGYSGYFADPDGNLWEVAHNPFLPLDESGNTHEK